MDPISVAASPKTRPIRTERASEDRAPSPMTGYTDRAAPFQPQEIASEPMADKLTTYTDGNWDKEVLGSDTPVLVDFWAEWCVPCKTLVPMIEAVAEQFGARLKVGKLNVEENAHVPYRYNITTLPTLMIFKRGQVSEQRVGLLSKENLIKLVEPHLG